MTNNLRRVGLLPAGGQAKRIAPLPCSKALFPVGFRPVEGGESIRPKVVSHYFLEKMRLAGVQQTYIVLRPGKWDIPTYYGDGAIVNMDLAYLMMRLPYGAPYTIDQAYPFVKDALIVFGFPDILFKPDNAFAQLIDRQATTQADVVLGLFPSDQPQKMDMVARDESGHVRQIVIKPRATSLKYTWIIAVWTPTFTRFMHERLIAIESESDETTERREVFVGHIIQAAIDEGYHVDAVTFSDGRYLDIGTPDDLAKAVRLSGELS